MATQFKAGDRVRVQYRPGKFYEGSVLWTETYLNLYWVTVKPDDNRYISTFGSARDMHLGYKSYIAELIPGKPDVVLI